MAKFQSPLLGYNNNVRHRGRVFHVQTEDSGVNHPHIITHLFMDGGRILKSVKKSYAEHVGTDSMSETVRVLMKEQHKAMVIALRDGQFDAVIDPKKSSSMSLPAVAPSSAVLEAAKPAEPPRPPSGAVAAPKIPSAPPTEPTGMGAIATSVAVPSEAPATIDEGDRANRIVDDSSVEIFVVESETDVAAFEEELVAEAMRATPDPRRVSVAELTLDFDALERESDPGPSPLFQASELPPPPKNLFSVALKEPGTGTYRSLEAEHHDDTRAPSARPEPRGPSAPPAESRYAPARPAAIFSGAAKPPPAPSIFSDDLVNDKSLDEVILSYLAEDLDPPRRK